MLTYSRVCSLVIFSLGSISIIAHLLFSSLRIPGDFILFEMGLMTFSIYFMYSIFKAGLNISERLFYTWLFILMVSVIFFIMHWPGAYVLMLINFLGLIGLLAFSVIKRKIKIQFPIEDSVLVFAVLLTVIMFSFLTPKLMEKYNKMNEDYERNKKMELIK